VVEVEGEVVETILKLEGLRRLERTLKVSEILWKNFHSFLHLPFIFKNADHTSSHLLPSPTEFTQTSTNWAHATPAISLSSSLQLTPLIP
jgi:hypothetical protein